MAGKSDKNIAALYCADFVRGACVFDKECSGSDCHRWGIVLKTMSAETSAEAVARQRASSKRRRG